MADTTIQFYEVSSAATCQSTGLAFRLTTTRVETLFARVYITNVGVSQDPLGTGPLQARVVPQTRSSPPPAWPHVAAATASSGISLSRRRRGRHLARQVDDGTLLSTDANGDGVADFEVTRSIRTTLALGEGVLGWNVDVPSGFYVVTATLENPATVAEVFASPRFFVAESADTSCIPASETLASTERSTSPTGSPTSTPATTMVTEEKAPLPVAAIVGISIAAVVLIILLVLVCVWNKRQQNKPLPPKRNAAAPRMEQQQNSSFFANDRGTIGGQTQTRTFAWGNTRQQPPPLPTTRR